MWWALMENCQKKTNHVAKFGPVNGRKFVYFFQKMKYFFSQKILKNIFDMEIIFFLLKKYTILP